MTTKPLTAREARFVEQYRLHGNAARAARDLGLYGRGARTIARAAGDTGEKRDANAELRARLLKIAARGKK